MNKTLIRFFLVHYLPLLLFPAVSHAQKITLTGNSRLFVAQNQSFQAPDGFTVRDNSTSVLPSTLTLNNGDVVLDPSTALYKVHSVPASGNAVFYSAVPGFTPGRSMSRFSPSDYMAGLAITNGSAGVSDFTLKLELLCCGSCIPVAWVVSQSAGSGFGDLTFSWDASLEPVELLNKRLYADVSGTVTALGNVTSGSYSLTCSGYNGTLSSTRFTIATGLTAATTTTDPICTGGTGSVSVSASGGLGSALEYKLGTGSWQADNQFTGLAAGTYTVYVKDDLGEETSALVTLTDPAPVTAIVTGNTSVCSGQSTTLPAMPGMARWVPTPSSRCRPLPTRHTLLR